jgi:hypothetical protein
MTFDFSRITEVRLAEGGHKNPNDGLCFMEMAAWFAGEKHSDKPECACPVLGAYGIRLNDRMPDDVRDWLLKPLVPMIVGTRDKDSEVKRAEFLAMWATNKILPIILRERGLLKEAEACESAASLSEAKAAAAAADAAAFAAASAEIAATYAASAAAYAATYAAFAATYANAANADAAEHIWTVAVEGLRQAILIGKHEGLVLPGPVFAERRQRLSTLACAC